MEWCLAHLFFSPNRRQMALVSVHIEQLKIIERIPHITSCCKKNSFTDRKCHTNPQNTRNEFYDCKQLTLSARTKKIQTSGAIVYVYENCGVDANKGSNKIFAVIDSLPTWIQWQHQPHSQTMPNCQLLWPAIVNSMTHYSARTIAKYFHLLRVSACTVLMTRTCGINRKIN